MISRIAMIVAKVLGLLPFGMLYGLSDVLYLIMYYGVGYRKVVVTDNLRRSFPEKSDKELAKIRRQFYRYFCDLLLESFKGLYMSEAAFRKRFIWANPTVFDEEKNSSKNIILLGSHYGNWEWGSVCMPLYLQHRLYGIYKQLSDRTLDHWLQQRRSRFGLVLVRMAMVARSIVEERELPAIFAFLADQTPVDVDHAWWLPFLNQDTPFYHGPEKLACQSGFPVYVYKIDCIRRGHYVISFHLLASDVRQLPEGELTKRYAIFLEKQIREAPQYWLWSHRRWKRAKPSTAFSPHQDSSC